LIFFEKISVEAFPRCSAVIKKTYEISLGGKVLEIELKWNGKERIGVMLFLGDT